MMVLVSLSKTKQNKTKPNQKKKKQNKTKQNKKQKQKKVHSRFIIFYGIDGCTNDTYYSVKLIDFAN